MPAASSSSNVRAVFGRDGDGIADSETTRHVSSIDHEIKDWIFGSRTMLNLSVAGLPEHEFFDWVRPLLADEDGLTVNGIHFPLDEDP